MGAAQGRIHCGVRRGLTPLTRFHATSHPFHAFVGEALQSRARFHQPPEQHSLGRSHSWVTSVRYRVHRSWWSSDGRSVDRVHADAINLPFVQSNHVTQPETLITAHDGNGIQPGSWGQSPAVDTAQQLHSVLAPPDMDQRTAPPRTIAPARPLARDRHGAVRIVKVSNTTSPASVVTRISPTCPPTGVSGKLPSPRRLVPP